MGVRVPTQGGAMAAVAEAACEKLGIPTEGLTVVDKITRSWQMLRGKLVR